MALRRFASQVATLMAKNLRSMLFRHPLLVFCMALLLPVLLASFFSFAKNLFVPPATFGFGTVHGVRTLPQAFDAARPSGRTKLVLVDAPRPRAPDARRLLDALAREADAYGPPVSVVRVAAEAELPAECRSSLRGVTACFAAVVVNSSPDDGPAALWNYTIRTDAALWESPYRINVDVSTNMEEIYLLPLQRAIDSIIAAGPGPLASTREMPFTSLTQAQRDRSVRELFYKSIVNFMGVSFITTVIWITYHVAGVVATERESGMSQLIDVMMPVPHPLVAPLARILSHHLSFSAVYAPAWIIGSIILRYGVFIETSFAIVLVTHLLAGLALASFAIFIATFFRRAQLSSVTAILATLLLAIFAQSLTQPKTTPVAVLSALFPPCNFVYFITLMARFERQHRPTSLSDLPPATPWEVPGIALWLLLSAQVVVYLALAVSNESCFYGTSVDGRHVSTAPAADARLGVNNAVQLDRFTKVYRPGALSRFVSRFKAPAARPQPVVAVDGLSLAVGRGQIVALLGANGSGKSTTLNAIAGLHRLTGGSITVDGTGGLGIAPQKNVLWDDLNVEEHLIIFSRLKDPENCPSSDDIADLVAAIDLFPKRKALSKTLSGGQKRKLQLGMMLAGGSAVCCVDEVSSGMDPLSRKKIWDILLAERGRRTLILTTHFLDEADLLADHIVVLSKGTLRAEGSSVELKDRFGGGYRVHVNDTPNRTWTPDVLGATKTLAFDSTTYTAPSSSLAARVIGALESAGINEYSFSGPTIEDVFLRLAEEVKDEQAPGSPDAKSPSVRVGEKGRGWDSSPRSSAHKGLSLMDGTRVGIPRQMAIMFRKRMTVFKKNRLVYLVALLLPVLAAALTSVFVRGKRPTGCSAMEQAADWGTQDALSQIRDSGEVPVFLAGPSSRLDASSARRLLAPLFAGPGDGGGALASAAIDRLLLVDDFDEFTRRVVTDRANITTGLWLGDDSNPPAVAWVANLLVASSLMAQQLLDVLLTNTTVATAWSGFDVPFNPGIGDALNLVIYMGIALACYPAFFGLYPSTERRGHVRALQYSNGVHSFPLWTAYLAFDLAIVLAASAAVTALWSGLSGVWYHLEYVFAVFFLYGLAATLLAYFASLFTKTQLATFAWAAAYQGVVFLVYLISYISVITFSSVERIDSSLLVCHFVISAVAPIGSAVRALFVSTNLFATACEGQAMSQRPASFAMYGGPIAYLVVQCLVLFGLLLWFDGGGPTVLAAVRGLPGCGGRAARGDDDEIELTRVSSNGAHDDGLRVVNLCKSFGKNTAVDNVSFGVERGEVFALLGPNGAGKSTTISLIRGDLKPSRNGGDVFVEELSVSKSLAAARMHLGVCPQVDALDQMTVREHLEFYARVRGIPDVQHNVSAVLAAVGLEAFEARMGHALSGGNKRKLSLGIALMGNPTVVLLDEPSSGLDAASKRIMWRALADTVYGRSMLLTTHSMEEVDALAGRAGILARRMLALGTPDDLRHWFGDVLHVHLVAASAPRTPHAAMERIADFIRHVLPTAAFDAKTYHGQLRFSVAAGDVVFSSAPPRGNGRRSAMGRLVLLLEENKSWLGVQHYSVSPTTLDQVFLSIVGRHEVGEEGRGEEKGGAKREWPRLRSHECP